jgi:hypothetical protein
MSIVFWKMSIVLEKISHVFSKTMDFFVLMEASNVAKKKRQKDFVCCDKFVTLQYR